MCLYKYTEFLHPGGYILEYVRENGTVFHSYRMSESTARNLAPYFIELLCFITLDSDFFDDKGYISYDRFNPRDLQIMKCFCWIGCSNNWSNPSLNEPMMFNPQTLAYARSFEGLIEDVSVNYSDCMKTLNIEKELKFPRDYTIVLRINQDRACLVIKETNRVVHVFENPNHVLWYAKCKLEGYPDRKILRSYYGIK